MLGRIGNQATDCAQAIPRAVQHPLESLYQRNEKDDVKSAIELLYEFKKKLSELHPIAQEVIDKIIQREHYR